MFVYSYIFFILISDLVNTNINKIFNDDRGRAFIFICHSHFLLKEFFIGLKIILPSKTKRKILKRKIKING